MIYNNQDITSANSQGVLTVEELFPNGLVLQQFSADAAMASDAVDLAETRMGVDGYMSAGVTPNITVLTITLEANSPSKASLDVLRSAMLSNRRLYKCEFALTIPSTDEVYLFSRGCLQNANSLPAINRVLAPTTWVFHFESMTKV